MNASSAESVAEIPERALAVVRVMLDSFDAAGSTVQAAVPDYLEQLAPLLSELSSDALRVELVQRLEELLVAFDWSASEDTCGRQIRLHRAANGLVGLDAIVDALRSALHGDAVRLPPAGWNLETIDRARRLALVSPTSAAPEVVAQLPAIEWGVPEQAAAIARARAELGRRAAARKDHPRLSLADAREAYGRQDIEDAGFAVRAWLRSRPTGAAVRSILSSASLRSAIVAEALKTWAQTKVETVRTETALGLITQNAPRPWSMEMICTGGVDEPKVVNAAAKRIRAFSAVQQRIAVAETLAGHVFENEKARKLLVGLIVFLLKPDKPKANIEVVEALVPAFGGLPLADPEPLTTSLRRAQKRHKLKFSRELGEQLLKVGVEPETGWFGSRAKKAIEKRLASLGGS